MLDNLNLENSALLHGKELKQGINEIAKSLLFGLLALSVAVFLGLRKSK